MESDRPYEVLDTSLAHFFLGRVSPSGRGKGDGALGKRSPLQHWPEGTKLH